MTMSPQFDLISSGVPKAALREARRRRSARLQAERRQRWAFRLRRLRRAILAFGLITLGAIAAGLFVDGLGLGAFLAIMLAATVISGLLAIFPSTPRVRFAELDASALPDLAAGTQAWLESHRAQLPEGARDGVDIIGARLDQLAPQLAAISPQSPAAQELRKLLSEDLPALVGSYNRISPALRDAARIGGQTPSQQLSEGLAVVSDRIEVLGYDLSQDHLDALATRNRYLESKYADHAP